MKLGSGRGTAALSAAAIPPGSASHAKPWPPCITSFQGLLGFQSNALGPRETVSTFCEREKALYYQRM